MEFKTILLSHDGSRLADAAIPYAAELARLSGATIIVVHVVEQPSDVTLHVTPVGEWLAQSADVVTVTHEVVAAEAREALAGLQHVASSLRAAAPQTDVTTLIAGGPPGEMIVDIASQRSADMIVIATHGRSGVQRALLGSVADYVVQHAPCAVLLCRPR